MNQSVSNMKNAAITGWGKCLPPAILSNKDLSTFLDTSDEWILQRTGISERRISHTSGIEMACVAAAQAIACAGLEPADIDLIVYGSCTSDEGVPNDASGLQVLLGAKRAACYDINTACTSFLYGFSTANALIRTGVVRNAVIVGVEVTSRIMDWENRDVAVLFGDGAGALVLQATDQDEGLLAESLGCYGDARQTLRVRGMGGAYTNLGATNGDTFWDFQGKEIFKRAVHGMSQASEEVLKKCGITTHEVDLVVPHQANLRIIEAVARQVGISMDKVFLTVRRYGNMSAATVIVALVEAVESGRIRPHGRILLPAFGAGLTWCSHLIRWGERTTPVRACSATLPPCELSALELVEAIRRRKGTEGRSLPSLRQPDFAESRCAESFASK